MYDEKIAIIGAGKVGAALAIALQEAGYKIAGVSSRTERSAAALAERVGGKMFADLASLTEVADVLILAVPDQAIEETAQHLTATGKLRQRQCVFHVCGSQSAEALACVRCGGASVGSLHPLQSFAVAETAAQKLRGTYFAVDGDNEARRIAREMIAVLGGKTLEIPAAHRALYHASACMASNYMVSVVYGAVRMLQKLGIEEREAVLALRPILEGTVENICSRGALQALTGPIVRGDALTLKKQLKEIDALSPEEATLYRSLGTYTLRMAQKRQSISAEQLAELAEILGEKR